ncbi:hypothetical protein KCP76_25835 [Salmonella enterica subsp. enterica serovar Weltevreden]|nr:hypothetical protein KCP76_25835 [Salmonella enterica subsp. enterica serovar Weltevreden]
MQLPAGIRLHILPDVYPAGDGADYLDGNHGRRSRPMRYRPASAWSSITCKRLADIARAVEQRFPVTRRTLTVDQRGRQTVDRYRSLSACHCMKCWRWQATAVATTTVLLTAAR